MALGMPPVGRQCSPHSPQGAQELSRGMPPRPLGKGCRVAAGRWGYPSRPPRCSRRGHPRTVRGKCHHLAVSDSWREALCQTRGLTVFVDGLSPSQERVSLTGRGLRETGLCRPLPSVEGKRDFFGWGRPAVKQGPDAKGVWCRPLLSEERRGTLRSESTCREAGTHCEECGGVNLPSEEEEGLLVRMSTRGEAGTDGRD